MIGFLFPREPNFPEIPAAGQSRLGTLLTVLFAAVLVYAGSQIFPFYYYYYELQGQMEAQAKKASFKSNYEIREYLLDYIKKYKIPIQDEDELRIFRGAGEIEIDLRYTEVFYIDLGGDRVYDIWEFDFHPRVIHPL